ATGLGDPGFEMVLHTAPNLRSRILQGDWATIRDDYHWHLEIVVQPEQANRVGGIFVNEASPEVSAARLRDAWPRATGSRRRRSQRSSAGLARPIPPGGC